MKAIVFLLACWLTSAFAQDATSIHGVPVATVPSFSAQPMPSGDTTDNLFLGMDPGSQALGLRVLHIASGPSMLFSNWGLVGNTQNYLWTAPGQYGMRTGLVAYIPRGVWELSGKLVVAGPSNTEYDVTVIQGTARSNDPNRAGIFSESPITVGGGVTTTTGPANMPIAIPFSAHTIQCAVASDEVCEVGVRVFPKNANGGAVLGGASPVGNDGGVPSGFVSDFVITRLRGF